MQVAPSVARTGGYAFSSQGGTELNFVDTALSAVVLDSTGAVTLLNGMAQGTTASTRIGRKITMKSFQIQARAQANAATTMSDCRVALVYDMQSNGAAPAITDIYDSASPTALRNVSNSQRFRVLWVWEDAVIGNLTTPSTGKETLIVNHYRRFDLPVQFNAGSAGTVGDIQTGGLFLVTVGQVAPGTSAAALNGTVRIRYSDH